MPRIGALTRARAQIEAALAQEGRSIYLFPHVEVLLEANRNAWGVPKSMTGDRFLRFLVSQDLLQTHELVSVKSLAIMTP